VVLCADEKMEEKDASTDQALKKSTAGRRQCPVADPPFF
jgi:hypothetical protein